MARPRKKKDALTIPDHGLPAFEGRPVLYSSIVIPNAGGGLREALQVDPIVLAHGEEAFVLMRVTTRHVDFVPASKDDDSRLVRKHTVDASDVVILSGKVAEPLLNEHLEAVRVLVDKAKGREPIDGFEDAFDGGDEHDA